MKTKKNEKKLPIEELLETVPETIRSTYERKYLKGRSLLAMVERYKKAQVNLTIWNCVFALSPFFAIPLILPFAYFTAKNNYSIVWLILPGLAAAVHFWYTLNRREDCGRNILLLRDEFNKFEAAIKELDPLGIGSPKEQSVLLARVVIDEEILFKKVRLDLKHTPEEIIAAGNILIKRRKEFEKHWKAMVDFELVGDIIKADVFLEGVAHLKSTMPPEFFK